MFPPQSTPSKRRVESYRIYKRSYSACSHSPDHPLWVTEKATHCKLVGRDSLHSQRWQVLQSILSPVWNVPQRPRYGGRVAPGWFRCRLKISYLELLQSSCAAEPFVQFWKKTSWGVFMWSYMNFGPVVQKERSFKDISYLELWQTLCSADPNHLCNFGRMYHEEQLWEIILNLDQWFCRKFCLMVFLIWISGSPFVQRCVTICAILVESIKRNNSVKLIWIWVRQWFRSCLLKYFLSGALATLLFSGAESFMQF